LSRAPPSLSSNTRACGPADIYEITAASGSGEYALSVLLSFGAHARAPMGPRLVAAARVGEVPDDNNNNNNNNNGGSGTAGSSSSAHDAFGRRPSTGASSETRVPHVLRTPVTLLYGASHDWMPAEAGFATAAALRRAGVDAVCELIPRGGHHCYMENPPDFAERIIRRSAVVKRGF
jgi:pimeloyl-ACP methyl ester carboxylesterase